MLLEEEILQLHIQEEAIQYTFRDILLSTKKNHQLPFKIQKNI